VATTPGTRVGGGSASALVAVVALQVAVVLPVFLVATLAPYLIRDLDIGEREVGIAVGAFYAVSGATAVWLGRVADRQTWQRGLVIASGGVLLPLTLLFLTSGPITLYAAMAALALAQSMGVGTTNLAIVDAVAPRRQGVAFGVKQAAVPGATMLAGVSAPLVAEQIGWRWAFVLAAVFPLAAVAVTGWRHRDAGTGASVEARLEAPVPPGRRRRLRLLAGAFGVGTFTSGSLGAFFVLYAVHEGFSPAAAGLTVAAASVVNIAMRVGMGWLADRRAGDAFARGGLLLAGGSVGYFLLVPGTSWLLPAAAVLAYGLGWSWQGLIHLGAVRLAPGAPGYATGVIRTGLAAGSASGPVFAGLLIGFAGYRPLWLLLGLLAGGAATAVLLTLRLPVEAA
jgi:MFS family permease